VASWEKGKFRPRGEKKAALVGLRKVRKRDVKKMLTENAKGKSKKIVNKAGAKNWEKLITKNKRAK
jgi:hypothetical protein